MSDPAQPPAPPAVRERKAPARARARRTRLAVCLVLGAIIACSGLALWRILFRPEPATPTELKRVLAQGPVRSVAYSSNGRYIAAAAGADVILFERDTGNPVHTFAGRHATALVTSLAFAPDGRHIVSATDYGELVVWDVETKTCHVLQEGRSKTDGYSSEMSFKSVCYSPDGHQIAVASWGSGVVIWDARSRQQAHRLNAPFPLNAVAFSPDGLHIATASDQEVRLWDSSDGAYRRTLPHSHDRFNTAVAFSPSGELAWCRGQSQEVNTISLWDRKTDRVRTIPGGDENGVQASGSQLAFSPDGRTLAVGEWTKGRERNRVRLFDVASGTLSGTILCPEQINSIAFSPDGRELAGGCGYKSGGGPHNPGYLMVWALPPKPPK